MANMFDYLDWYGDFDFYTVPFNEVDNLIFCQLSYLDLEGVVPSANEEEAFKTVTVSEAAERFSELYPPSDPSDLGPLISADTNALLPRMAAGKRFRDVRLRAYEAKLDPETHEQFGAVTAELPDGTLYVAYRGTNDDLVGWLEDCEMSYKIVPSQEHALTYLERIGFLTRGPLRVGGHSKGGNLAAYAVSRVSEQLRSRVVDVWCNDSPGFENRVIPLESLRCIVPLVHFYTPEFSVVGALFDHLIEPVVIKSSGSGVMEHSAVEWRVMRGNFVRGTSTQNGSVRVRETFNKLMDSRDLPGRKKLLDSLYEALNAQGIHGMNDMFSQGLSGINATLASVNALDDDDRQTMNTFLSGIIGATVANAVTDAVTPVAKQLGHSLRGAVKALATTIGNRTGDAADEQSEPAAEYVEASEQEPPAAADSGSNNEPITTGTPAADRKIFAIDAPTEEHELPATDVPANGQAPATNDTPDSAPLN